MAFRKMSDIDAVVLDNGTGFLKAGFAGCEQPCIFGRCAVGHSFQETSDIPCKCFVGDDLVTNRSQVNIQYPMKNGAVIDWDDMQLLWEYIFYRELKIDTTIHPILITENPLNSKVNREHIAEVLFEIFNFPAMYIAMPSILSMYSLSRTSGLILDCGEGVTSVVPVHDGYALPHAIKRQHISGRDVTNYLSNLIQAQSIPFIGNDKHEMVRELKEAMCYVKPYPCSLCECSELMASYILPDGNEIKLGHERFKCAEALFNPSIIGIEAEGVHELVYGCIMKCDTDLRRNLYSNIVLTGGSTMIPGFDCRIQNDLLNMAPPSVKVEIVTPSERPTSAWVGGSILASLSLFGNMCITKKEYEESGLQVVHTFT